MGETNTRHQTTRILEGRNSGGQIVEVEGGHIIRSTGKKDRHSKVCTAKGPRDRRVRLSAHTAIQFYDVQDRLGYDRPSKAVDWLIKKAKSAIDELAESTPMHWQPPFPPHTTTSDTPEEYMPMEQRPCFEQANENSSDFPLPSLNSEGSAMEFQNFPPISQDLRLSLQSMDPRVLLQAQYHHQHEPVYNQMGVEISPNVVWSDNQSSGETTSWYPLALSQQQQEPQLSGYLGSQGGPLQSNNSPSVPAWMDQPTYQSHRVHHPSTIGFSRFLIPARIGEAGDNHGVTNKPSST